MVVVENMKESMGREEAVIAAEQKSLHRDLWGDADPTAAEVAADMPKENETDDMKIMAAHDVHVTYYEPPQPTPPATEPPPEPPVVPAVVPEPDPAKAMAQPPRELTPKPASTLAKAVTAAALLAGGGGIGALVPWLAGAFDRPAAEQPAATETEPPNTYGLSL